MIAFSQIVGGTCPVSYSIKSEAFEPEDREFSTKYRPIVMWNMTYACNLRCKHCYIDASCSRANELTTEEAKQMIDELAEIGVPMLGLTGGEPLVREDFFELAKYAIDAGLRVIVSSNGTLITEEVARKLKDLGISYVGISLDGASPETHDGFRGMPGSFDRAIEGLRNCVKVGLNCGIRVTVTKRNYREVPALIDLALKLSVPRFCLYHLVYTGRGVEIISEDITLEEKRKLLDFLYAKSKELREANIEILTTDSPMDGVYLLKKLVEEGRIEDAGRVERILARLGGCSVGRKICGIDPLGNVHPCQFMSNVTVGNIREQSFKEIWWNDDNPVLAKFRNLGKHLKGKCGDCYYKDICGGCRLRALAKYGDIMEEDPMCFLSREEVSKPILAR